MDLASLPRLDAPVIREIECRAALAESPLWLPGPGLLLWVDALAGTLYVLDDSSGPWRVHRLAEGDAASAVAADTQGGILLTAGTQVTRLDLEEITRPTLHATLPADPPGVRFNDAKVGPDGRLWAGTVRPGTDAGGALWTIDADGRAERHLTGVTHGNGLAWNPAGNRLYFVDSGPRTLTRFGYDTDLGLTGPGQTLLRLPPEAGVPDGLATDAEGGLWLAVWGAGRVLRLTPDGEPIARIDLPARHVTSCAFTGARRDLLAVTTAADDDRPGGSVHLLDVGVTGMPVPAFGTPPTGPHPAPPPARHDVREPRWEH